MRIKKYENWKLNNINQPIYHHQQINKHKLLSQQQSFSISQLLETPKKQLNKQREHNIISNINTRQNNNYFNNNYLEAQVSATTSNLNHRLLQKTQIYLHNNNTNDNINTNNTNNNTSTFRTQQQQQRTQREQIIKHKIKKRIKQQYLNCNNDDDQSNSSSFHYTVGMTNRSFFNNSNNNNINNNNHYSNKKGDFIMALSFDERASRCFDNNNNNNNANTVHIEGKSFPINSSFTHKRSKSTVIKRGLINSSAQKHHNQQFKYCQQRSSYNNNDKDNNNNNSHSTRKRVYSVEMKRQNSSQSNMKQKIHPKYQLTSNNNNNNNNKIYLKDIQPWQFDIAHDGFDINI